MNWPQTICNDLFSNIVIISEGPFSFVSALKNFFVALVSTLILGSPFPPKWLPPNPPTSEISCAGNQASFQMVVFQFYSNTQQAALKYKSLNPTGFGNFFPDNLPIVKFWVEIIVDQWESGIKDKVTLVFLCWQRK